MKHTIIKFRHAIIALLMIVLNSAGAWASAPWTVNPSDYRYDMSLYLDVTFAHSEMDYSLYDVGVFCGDECRGVAEVLQLSNGKSCLYVRARSNSEQGETMTFKYYNRETNTVESVDGVSFTFESNGRLGYPSEPYQVKIIRHYDVILTAGKGGKINHEGGRIAEGTQIELTATPDEGYHFEKWSDESVENPRTIVVNDNVNLNAEFKVNTYKLIYTVDGAEYKTYDIDYGTALTPEALPEKEGHTFSGWQGLPETMPAHDVTVSGTFSINSYDAVFKIGDEFTQTVTVVFGQPITPPEAPAKEGHTFMGWQNVPETMPARNIEITGEYKVNQYKLTYIVDGETYKEDIYDYGTELTPEAQPEKEGHTFSGWQGMPETMPAKDVTVSGTFSINSYDAVFKIGDEFTQTVTVVFGQPITPPEAPAKEGHTFMGWQEVPETMPARNIEITGEYKVNQYKLTYIVDGETYKEDIYDYGTELTPEAQPEKEGHTFSGWEGLPETMPAHDVTVTGTFSINSYEVVFKIGDEVIEKQTVEFGQPITAPEAPAKEGHTFAGWQDVPETMPARNLEIVGQYTVNQYKLIYMVDGELYKEVLVDFGAAIEAEMPEKEGHTFSGWEGLPETMPANDVTVTGTFTINSYEVVFKIGDEVIEKQTVEFGQPITAPEAPAKEGHTFAGWQDVPETMPARNLEITGQYTVNQYKLIYMVDGELYKEVLVDFGATIEAEVPEKEGHTFSGWEGLPETMPANDVTVTGTFSINSYEVVFKIGDEVIEKQTVEFGQLITAPEAPAKEGHTFAGWQDVPETMPAHDVEIVGQYTVNQYKLIYMVDGELYKEVLVDFGATIEAEVPEKEGYTFSGWEGLPETMPANDVTVTGTFSINSYEVVFKIGDEVIEKQTVEFGQPITAPEAPAKEGHTFAGWQDVPETMPAHDVEIVGQYTVNQYKLIYMVDGELYKEVLVDFGATIEAEVPEKEGHTFSGWEGLPETMPANDVTVTGKFVVNKYKLILYLNDEVYSTSEVEFGAALQIDDPAVPEGYTFDGWKEEIPKTMPAHDVVLHGTYSLIEGIGTVELNADTRVTVYTVNGQLIGKNLKWYDTYRKLENGLYIINGTKVLIRK